MSLRTHNLQLVLPELLLVRLVQERELAHMVHEDVSQDGEVGLEGRDLAVFRAKGSAEALERSRRAELIYLEPHLLGNELSLEIYAALAQLPRGSEGMAHTVLLLPAEDVHGCSPRWR